MASFTVVIDMSNSTEDIADILDKLSADVRKYEGTDRLSSYLYAGADEYGMGSRVIGEWRLNPRG